MAVLMRGGIYDDFVPSKLRPREWAVVLSGDPNVKDGKAVYICFSAGDTKQIATYEDMKDNILDATGDIRDAYIAAFDEIKTSIEEMQILAESAKNISEQKAEDAKKSADIASESESKARESAAESRDYSLESKSYAVGEGGVRENEAVDNARFYYEQLKRILQELEGVLIPMGTIFFYELFSVDAKPGYMYNIKDSFVTDETFKEGAGFLYPEGTNVYKTASGYWDCLAGTLVTGVKGDGEDAYRIGNVNITAKNIGIKEATPETPGIVKPDGTTITIDEDGTIHGSSKVDLATPETPGIVKPDGTTITLGEEGEITSIASGFTGTSEEVNRAIKNDEIKDGTIVNITDDYTTGSIDDATVDFEEAAEREALRSGDAVPTLFGKIKKWLSDLKPVAFSGKLDDLNDTRTTDLALKKGFYSNMLACASAGYDTWSKILAIRIIGEYINAPFEITVGSRYHVVASGAAPYRPVLDRLTVAFQGTSGKDPELIHFYAQGSPESPKAYYLKKETTDENGRSTWGLYVRKAEAYDQFCVHDIKMSPYISSRVEVLYFTQEDPVSSISGGYEPTYYAVASHDSEGHNIAEKLDSIEADVRGYDAKLEWKMLASVNVPAGGSYTLSYTGTSCSEFLVSYGTPNSTQAYGGGTVVIAKGENKPCILPVYYTLAVSALNTVAYIYNDIATNGIKVASYGSNSLRFIVWYR